MRFADSKTIQQLQKQFSLMPSITDCDVQERPLARGGKKRQMDRDLRKEAYARTEA
jgi:hypothetical protein